ncbi:MAG: MBG domain-containing protein [Pyrinomonadaceae bacterium]
MTATPPEINVKGNGVSILDGDVTPSLSDHSDFGTADVASGTVVRTFTIENLGGSDLTLGIPSVTISGTNAADFTVTQQSVSPVNAGNSTTFQVTFDPNASGLRTATLSITNNDSNENPYDFAIQGTGSLGATSLSNVPSTTAFVGDTLSVSSTLTRTTAPAGVVSGQTVTFTRTYPSSTLVTEQATTDASGVASIGLSLAERGAYTVNAHFGGSSSLAASNSNTATISAYQKTSLSFPAVSATAGTPENISATLTALPSGVPLSGQTVSFDFGGVVTAGNAVTNAGGVATITRTFPSGGTFPATASFADVAGFYADSSGNQVPTTANVNITVTQTAPTVSTNAATSVTTTTADLNGVANPNGSATNGRFRYSTTNPGTCNDTFGTVTGNIPLGSGTSNAAFAQGIGGLSPGTTYFYCAIGENSGGIGLGTVQQFTTLGAPPTISTIAATSVTTTTADLNGTANPNDLATTAWYRYSTTNPGTCNDTFGTRAPAAGGISVGSGNTNVAFAQGITGLVPGTTYFYCAIGQNSLGTSFGTLLQFTAAGGAPTVTTGTATSVTTTTADLNGTVNPNSVATNGRFRYSSTSPGTCNDTFGTVTGDIPLGSGSTNVALAQGISSLSPGTTYFYCAIAQNAAGISFGTLQQFTTLGGPPTITTNAAASVTSTTADLNGTANPNNLSTTGWFRYSTTDPGTCNDTFGTRAPSSGGISLGSGSTNVALAQGISGLTANTTYYYCAIASNSLGTAFGSVSTFTTAGPTFCVPATVNGCSLGDNLARFSLLGESGTSVDNVTGATCSASPLAYSDFTALPAVTIARGGTFSGFMKTGNANDYATIWIDANDDAVFQDSERILDNLNIGTVDKAYAIHVPTGMAAGTHRLRVRNVGYAVPPTTVTDSCASYAGGETEDYTVTINSTALTTAVATGTANSCIPGAEMTIGPASNNSTSNILIVDSQNRYIARIGAGGNDLGTVRTNLYINGAAVRQGPSPANTYYLDRNVTITPERQPVNPYTLRYFYLTSELNSLIFQPGSGVTSQFDLNMTKTDQTGCNTTVGGTAATLVAPTGFGSVGGDRFLDFTGLTSFSGLYLHGGSQPLINPATPDLTINDVSVTEGNAGTVNANFTVSLSAAAPAGGVTFDISTANGTASQPGDYTQNSLTSQTIPAGSSTYTFAVSVNGDMVNESDETFFVNVTNVTGAVVNDGQGQGTILNDDSPNGTIQFSSPAYSVGEGAGTATITATRTGGTYGAVGIIYATTPGGSALGGAACGSPVDYLNASGTLSFADGDGSNKTFSVTICEDANVEPNETVNLQISGPTGGATLGSPAAAVLTINDNDALDYGDAPTAAQSGFASSYPTLLADNGARHTATGPRLGATRDSEADGQPNATATGDGADEDGVTIGSLTPGANATATINSSGAGFVNAWVDFNRDGDWADAGEQVLTNLAVAAGNNSANLPVPAAASIGTSFARFRLTSASVASPSPSGSLPDGEVEDFQVTIVPIPDLTVDKTHTGNFFQNQTGATYSIAATNSGTAPTVGTVTVTDTLPAGMVATAIAGSGWTCSLGTLTCTRADALAAGASYPAITLTVNVSGSAPTPLVNSVTVAGGGEVNTGNNGDTDSTTITSCSLNIVVQNTNDAGAGSLRQAVIDACPGATITFAPAVTGTIALTTGQITIDKDLNIQGPGANVLTVSGSNLSRMLSLDSHSLSVSGLTFANGNAIGAGGGAIATSGLDPVLSIARCNFTGNIANAGGALAGLGIWFIADSTFSGNTASSGAQGSALYPDGRVGIINSTFSNNLGGSVIFPFNGSVSITGSTFTGNSRGVINGGGTLILNNSIIANSTIPAGDCPGIAQGNNNFLEDVGLSCSQFVGSNNIFGVDPNLGPLANNGGPTLTHALLPGSQAINAGGDISTLSGAINNATTTVTVPALPSGDPKFTPGLLIQVDNEQMLITAITGVNLDTLTVTRGANGTTAAAHANGAAVNPAFDQRGVGFPRRFGAAADIGAFEVPNTPPTITPAVGVTRQLGSPSSNSQIATAGDAETALNALTLAVNGGATATVNGVTVTLTDSNAGATGINPNAAGAVFADVVATCGATTATFNLTVTDGGSLSTTGVLTVTVSANTPPTLNYAPQSVVAGSTPTFGTASGPSDNGTPLGSVTLQSITPVTGGAGGLTLSVNPTTGQVQVLTALITGSYTVAIAVTDNCGATTTATFTVNVTCPTITLNPATMPNAAVNAAYGQTFSASPVGGNYTFAVTSGALPAGLTLNSNGSFSGAPTTAGTFNFRITATGFGGCTGFRDYSLTVNKANSNTAITSDTPDPSVVGQNYTVTATATSATAGPAVPTGNVTVTDGTNTCVFTLPATSCQLASTTAGAKSLTATYSGDANFNGSVSATAPHTVNPVSTATGVQVSINAPNYGSTLTATATMVAVAPGSGIPQGTVSFNDGGNAITGCQNVPVSPLGAAVCTTNQLPAGTNKVIQAVFTPGNANFNGSNGSATQTIGKAPLNVQASSATVTYGDAAPVITSTITGFVLGETAANLTTQPGCSTTYTQGSPVSGSQYPASCSGGVSNNYSFNYLNGNVTVNKKALTVAADNKSRGYGTANPALTATLSGFVLGQNLATSGVTGTPTLSTTATATSPAGNYPIAVTIGTLQSGNYSFGTFTNGTLTVTAAQLTITADNQTRVYGAPNPALTFQITGFVNGEGVGVLTGTPSVTTTATATSTPGTYPITVAQGTLASANYTFATANGTLTVTTGSTTTTITNAAALGTATSVGQSYPVNWTTTPVAPATGTPTGNVTVTDGSQTCTAPVAAGTCNLTSTTSGTKTITATYTGDANFTGSTSQSVQHNVVIGLTGNVKQFVAFGTNTNLAGVTITLTNTTTQQSTTTTTDASGNYSFVNVTLGQNFTITPSGLGKVYEATSRTYNNAGGNISGADFLAYDVVGPNSIPRSARVQSQIATQGQPVTVPILFTATGVETKVSFSVEYPVNALGIPTVTCGSGTVNCTVTIDNSLQGKAGITVTPTTALTAGTREIVKITFPTFQSPATSAQIRFGDFPTTKDVRNAENNALPTLYWTDGLVSFTGGTLLDGASISGRVTTAAGQGLRNATVTLLDTAGGKRTTVTSSFGNYQFENLDTGRDYMLIVTSKRYRFAAQRVTLNESLGNVMLVGLE